MLKVICNFIPMDIDINISRCEYGKYDIDITCDNNVYVYLAKVKDIKRCTECMPESDKENFKETKRTIQSSSALSLLKYAVKDIWGIDEDFSALRVSENGKPYVDGYSFSISHSGALVCVAISKQEVGVDIECSTTPRNWLGLRRRVLTQKEKEEVTEDSKSMTEIWTKKEAVFKLLGDKVFSPSKIDIEGYYIDTIDDIWDAYDNEDYVLSVATKEKSNNYLFVKAARLHKDNWELE